MTTVSRQESRPDRDDEAKPLAKRANHAPLLLFAFIAATGAVAYYPEIRALFRPAKVATPVELDTQAVASPNPLDPLAPLPRTVPRAPSPAGPDPLAPRAPGPPPVPGMPTIPGMPGDDPADPMAGGTPGMLHVPGMPRIPGGPPMPGPPRPGPPMPASPGRP